MKKIKNPKKSLFLFSFFLIFFSHNVAQSSSIKDGDLVLGNVNAPITIIEYASLSCNHCAKFHKDTLPQLIEEYIDTGKAKLIFRNFPLNYPALMGSMVLQCLDTNIRYDYLSVLFELQSNWVKREIEEVEKELFKIFQTGGMTKELFNQCLKDKEAEQTILQGLIDAQNEFQINTTPSFIINGTKLEGNKPMKDFKKIIESALKNIE